MASRCWYYMTETKRRTPVADLDFQPLISAGVITAETMVWTEGMDDWEAAGEIHPELFRDPSSTASTDLPTVLQMVRSLSAPTGRASVALRASAFLAVVCSIALGTLVVYGAWLGSEFYGPKSWFLLVGLLPAAAPGVLAIPLFQMANTSRMAHLKMDRGAFYAMSQSMGKIAWLGMVLAALVLAILVTIAVFAFIYRQELIEVLKTAGS